MTQQENTDNQDATSNAELERRVRELSAELEAAKQAQAKLAHDALHDPLTSLPNRTLFMEHLERMLYYAQRHTDTVVAVLFVDLDEFKTINDALGHAGGDEVLMAVAARIRRVLRHSDVVARLGGDEFVVALDGLPGIYEAEEVARRLGDEIRSRICVRGSDYVVTASIGIATIRPDHTTPRHLVHDADIAMYKAKESGRDTYRLFDPSMALAMFSLPDLEAPLRRAVALEEFEIHYQEIHSLSKRRPVGCEALLRWRDGSKVRSPGEFIHIAEEVGLMPEIGSWVMRKACQKMAADHSSRRDLYVSINVSFSQFFDSRFIESVEQSLADSGLDAARLIVEITETIANENPVISSGLLRDLQRLGVRVQVDEFGSRRSALNRLLEMPISALKISRDVVGSITGKNGTIRIVSAVVNMAHSLGLEVVAEGIETTAQLDRVQELGCDFGQGYYLSRPVPASLVFNS